MSEPLPFSNALKEFITSCEWTFAKTYAQTWPHEYIVRDRVDEGKFLELVGHIRAHGYQGKFYNMTLTYFDHEGMTYWTMGAPINETIIVNRCRIENTYEQRLKNGTLPEQKQ